MPRYTPMQRAALAAPVIVAGAVLSLGVSASQAVTPPPEESKPYIIPPYSPPAPAKTFKLKPPPPPPAPPPAPEAVLPVSGYHLTARFGAGGSMWSSNHTGLDFAVGEGTPIHAIASGVITETVYDGAYGNKTVLQLEDGTEIWYCHQSSFDAGVGTKVTAGQVIGYVGSTGNSTGPHLHLEVRPGGGDPIDPAGYLAGRGLAA
ncbi:M23 family metallopeptidase [Nocardioides speluncae]|uniref:M23 family metallopeptidase n=1 Tax=Nocardioides speluncae TaxID=2670337 RepID=UPI000D689786|nr:M23 family metallopeptidase [Nocardioides speluncae]